MAEPRIDVSVERADAPPADDKHPNTCPGATRTIATTSSTPRSGFVRTAATTLRCARATRIAQLADDGSFVEEAGDLRSDDPLDFFDLRPYTERLAEAELKTGLGEAIVIGQAPWTGRRASSRPWTSRSWAARWGVSSARSSSRACDSAIERGVPLVSVSASGGARMQEGILALMQLPKTIAAVEDLHDAGCALISVLAHPTTGGVLASFASLGDVLIAEPGALMSFAGPRVVQQTTREKLPDDFGLAESNLRFGHVDAIVPRPELRPYVARLLRLFSNGG